eukprot:jgi/Ulvmu1/10080/UM006_0027.1
MGDGRHTNPFPVQTFEEFCVNTLDLPPRTPCATAEALQTLACSCNEWILRTSNYNLEYQILTLEKSPDVIRWVNPFGGQAFRREVVGLRSGDDATRANVCIEESTKDTPPGLISYVLKQLGDSTRASHGVHARKNMAAGRVVLLYRGHVITAGEESAFERTSPPHEAYCQFLYAEAIPLGKRQVSETLLSSPPYVDLPTSWGGFLNDCSLLEDALGTEFANNIFKTASALAEAQGESAEEWIAGCRMRRTANVEMKPCVIFNVKDNEAVEIEFFMAGVALKPIQKGEELLLQYGEAYFKQQTDTIINKIRQAHKDWEMRHTLTTALSRTCVKLLDAIDQVSTSVLPVAAQRTQQRKHVAGAIDLMSHINAPSLHGRLDLSLTILKEKLAHLTGDSALCAPEAPPLCESSRGTTSSAGATAGAMAIASPADAVRPARSDNVEERRKPSSAHGRAAHAAVETSPGHAARARTADHAAVRAGKADHVAVLQHVSQAGAQQDRGAAVHAGRQPRAERCADRPGGATDAPEAPEVPDAPDPIGSLLAVAATDAPDAGAGARMATGASPSSCMQAPAQQAQQARRAPAVDASFFLGMPRDDRPDDRRWPSATASPTLAAPAPAPAELPVQNACSHGGASSAACGPAPAGRRRVGDSPGHPPVVGGRSSLPALTAPDAKDAVWAAAGAASSPPHASPFNGLNEGFEGSAAKAADGFHPHAMIEKVRKQADIRSTDDAALDGSLGDPTPSSSMHARGAPDRAAPAGEEPGSVRADVASDSAQARGPLVKRVSGAPKRPWVATGNPRTVAAASVMVHGPRGMHAPAGSGVRQVRGRDVRTAEAAFPASGRSESGCDSDTSSGSSEEEPGGARRSRASGSDMHVDAPQPRVPRVMHVTPRSHHDRGSVGGAGRASRQQELESVRGCSPGGAMHAGGDVCAAGTSEEKPPGQEAPDSDDDDLVVVATRIQPRNKTTDIHLGNVLLSRKRRR